MQVHLPSRYLVKSTSALDVEKAMGRTLQRYSASRHKRGRSRLSGQSAPLKPRATQNRWASGVENLARHDGILDGGQNGISCLRCHASQQKPPTPNESAKTHIWEYLLSLGSDELLNTIKSPAEAARVGARNEQASEGRQTRPSQIEASENCSFRSSAQILPQYTFYRFCISGSD